MKNTNPLSDAYVVGAVDMFQETAAPYHIEERFAGMGSRYFVRVYEPVAYTKKHMAKSDETKRLVRWVVKLSNGMRVSQEGVLRLRAPEVWDRVRPMVAKLRGEKREQAMANAIWSAITHDERLAMIRSVNLTEYTTGRGLDAAQGDLFADLAAGGSLLAHVDGAWRKRLLDVYAEAVFGGPMFSREWYEQTWHSRLRFGALTGGSANPDDMDTNPYTMPLAFAANGDMHAPGWWRLLSPFANTARPDHAREVLSILTDRIGGMVSRAEFMPFPDNLEERMAVHTMRDARLGRMSESDRQGIYSLLYRRRGYEGDSILAFVHSAWDSLAQNAWTLGRFSQPRKYDLP